MINEEKNTISDSKHEQAEGGRTHAKKANWHKTSGQRRKEALANLGKELRDTFSGDNGCATLEKQARLLDRLFLHTLYEANKNDNLRLFSLALRAQNNYRKTVMTLYKLRYHALSSPSLREATTTVIARNEMTTQSTNLRKNVGANYTNLQNTPKTSEQTIQTTPTSSVIPREQSEPKDLVNPTHPTERINHAKMDKRIPYPPTGNDNERQTMEKINWPQNARGQEKSGLQPHQTRLIHEGRRRIA